MSDPGISKVPKGYTAIPKLEDWEHGGPGWVSVTDICKGRLKPIIICQCGYATGIGLHHVYPDGHITASFFHSHGENPCGWHVYLFLEGYADEVGVDFPPD